MEGSKEHVWEKVIEILISEEALKDLRDGFAFYEKQSIGVGEYFADSLRADIERLYVTAGVHKYDDKGFYRAFGRSFPYAIYYTFKGECVAVLAVIDCRRDPDWIRERLG